MLREEATLSHSTAFLSKVQGKKPIKAPGCNFCKKLGLIEGWCYKKMVKEQAKEHATLIAYVESTNGDLGTSIEPEERALSATLDDLFFFEMVDDVH